MDRALPNPGWGCHHLDRARRPVRLLGLNVRTTALPETIIFDFFGTLVGYSRSRSGQGYPDSDAVLRSAGLTRTYDDWLVEWEASFADFDRRSQLDLAEFSMADAVTTFLDRVGLTPDESVAAHLAATYLREWNAGVTDIVGLRGMLEQLAERHRLAVVSNTNDVTLVPDHLARIGIADLFEAVVLSVEVGHRKPHPAIYEAALERLHSDPGRTLFVGDTLDADYHGPRRAGMHAMLITEIHREIPAEDQLATVLDLPAALNRRHS